MVSMAAAEGIKTDLMLRVPGRLPGLYMIETDSKGERRFRYWRGEAPARELFELPDWNRIAESMMGARLIFFSGITLSLYSNTGLGRLLAIIEMARQQGAKIAFDGNFRPQGWKGDLPRTRTVFMEALKRVDVALPTFDDEAVLWGDPESGGDGRAAAGVRRRRDRGQERPEQRIGRGRRTAGVHPAAGDRRSDRHHRGGRQLQRRLYRGAALRRKSGLGGRRRTPPRRRKGPPPRRDHAAQRRGGALGIPCPRSFRTPPTGPRKARQ